MTWDSLRAELAKALEADDAEAAWKALLPHEGEVGVDRTLTALWLEVLRQTPGRASLIAEARQAISAFADDPSIVIAACAALVARAERRAPDEPPLNAEGPAHEAAQAAKACFQKLTKAQAEDPRVGGYLLINYANALRLAGPQHDQDAHQAYYDALQLDDANGHWWFDLGLLHKWRGRFDNAYAAMLKARARLGETRGVLWNMAICATALGEGDVAAGAFRDLGLPIETNEKSGMPFIPDLPPVQVRVLSRGAGYADSAFPDQAVGFEVVWVAPISPCHGIVQSASFRDTPIDYGDIVLWDGAPVGVDARGDGAPVPRFPLLEVLRRGEHHRLRFVADGPGDDPLAPLREALPEGAQIFVAAARIESARPSVLTGQTLEKDTAQSGPTYGKVVLDPGVDLDTLRGIVEAIVKRDDLAIAIPELYEKLGPAKRAGQEHQAWRGIERAHQKRAARGEG